MDVLNKECANYWTTYEYFTGGLALCFNQSYRQKSARGIVVANPEAAREFAYRLLSYADREQEKYTTTKCITLEQYEKDHKARIARAKPAVARKKKKKVTKKKATKKKVTKKKVRR